MDAKDVFPPSVDSLSAPASNFVLGRRAMIQLLVGAAVLPAVLGPAGQVHALSTPASGAPLPLLADALRRTEMPDLAFEQVGRIKNARYRVTFFRATWTGGGTFVRDIEVRDNGTWVRATTEEARFQEQWVVLTGDEPGTPSDYYTTMTPEWVAFSEFRVLAGDTAELRATTASSTLVVRWSLAGRHPELQWTVTSNVEQHVIVGYQSVDPVGRFDVEEVLCGAIQHARVVEGIEAIGAWEMFSPMSLAQHSTSGRRLVGGVYVPSEVIEFVHEREYGPNAQPWGMTLRNEERRVQPVVVAPHGGESTLLGAGQSRGFAVGVYLGVGRLWDAYADLARSEYGLSRYREHVFGTSLTDAAHNMIDLISIDPAPSADGKFVPSFSGWWPRGKGFADLEWNGNVRTAVAGVPLSAYYLLGTPATAEHIYTDRALPMIELHVSRRHVGSTPYRGVEVPEGAGGDRLGGIVGDASTLVPVLRQLRGAVPAIGALARRAIDAPPAKSSRTPINTPLAAYWLSKDPSWLAEAHAVARVYARQWLANPYTVGGRTPDFAWNLVKGWTELSLVAELTGDAELLEHARTEVRRFVTLTQLRPIPGTQVTVPTAPVQLQERWTEEWESGPIFADYPRHDIPFETVPAWMVSTSGLTFEQLSTFHIAPPAGGFVLNGVWAGNLLTLAARLEDDILRDVAHNLVVGRFGNYPGYYYRQSNAATLHPDFPLTGPHGLSSIYHHHAPAQLGLTLDYLFAEHEVRSGGEVVFPWEYEVDFVYFRYRTFGHAPGRFYDVDGVWPYFPRGMIVLDNPHVNWIAGVSEDALHLSLTNNSATAQRVRVDFDAGLTGVPATGSRPARVKQTGVSSWKDTKITRGALVVSVPPKGHAAIVVPGVGDRRQPWHREPLADDRSTQSYAFETLALGGDFGAMRGMLVARPDGTGYDAYIQLDWQDRAQLEYTIGDAATVTIDDGRFPNEWTIRVEDAAAPFAFRVSAGGTASQTHTLSLSPVVTRRPMHDEQLSARVSFPASTTPGDEVPVRVVVAAPGSVELDDAHIELAVPDGWSATPGDADSPSAGVRVQDWKVRVADDASSASHDLRAHVTAGALQTDSPALAIEVRKPVRLLDLALAAAVVAPGASVAVTATVVNIGAMERTDTVTFSVPTGWSASVASKAVSLPARGEAVVTVEISAPAGASRGTSHAVAASLSDGTSISATLTVESADILITPQTEWPAYQQNGWWLESSLAGLNGTRTFYNDIETGPGTGTVQWRPEVGTAGWFEVAVWYPQHATSTTAATYRIHHADGVDERVVDQTRGGSAWYVFGVYRFEAGSGGFVELEGVSDGFRRVNSARFRPSSSQPPTIVVHAPTHAVAGTPVDMAVDIAAFGSPVDADTVVALPPGWTIEPAQQRLHLSPGQSTSVTFRVTPPVDAPADTLFEGRVSLGDTREPFAAEIGDASAHVIVVDTFSARYSESGTWYGSSLPGYDGRASRFAVGGAASPTASWSPALAEPGRYLVSVWYPANATSTEGAQYDVLAGDQVSATVSVNQRQRAGTWRPLAVADLSPDTARLRLTATAPGYHRTSAAAFARVVPIEPSAI